MTVPKRIGIFGGTFDPVHIGHLVAAVEARFALGLDRVLLVVANEPWQKVGDRDVSRAEDRFAMVAAAVEGIAGLEASRIEIERGGPSYTADTVRELGASNPGAELFVIVGDDVAGQIDTWQRGEEMRELVTLAVVHRGGIDTGPDPLGWRVVRVDIPAIELSSTELRDRLATGRPVDFLIPERAITCIRRRGMYSVGR